MDGTRSLQGPVLVLTGARGERWRRRLGRLIDGIHGLVDAAVGADGAAGVDGVPGRPNREVFRRRGCREVKGALGGLVRVPGGQLVIGVGVVSRLEEPVRAVLSGRGCGRRDVLLPPPAPLSPLLGREVVSDVGVTVGAGGAASADAHQICSAAAPAAAAVQRNQIRFSQAAQVHAAVVAKAQVFAAF